MDRRSSEGVPAHGQPVAWAEWDEELLGLELLDLKGLDFDLSLTGFDSREIDDLLTFIDHDKHEDVRGYDGAKNLGDGVICWWIRWDRCCW
jgi:hypothetical protein